MLHKFASYALMFGACIFLCVSCTESDDGTAAMAESISNGSGGDLVLASMAPIPGVQAMPIDLAVETASVDLEFCKVDVKPNGNSAKTAGYCVNLFDDDGKMMGAFEIGETGSMAIACSSKVTSYKPMLNFSGENIDGEKLDRFMVYPKNMKPGDVYEPLLAIEYRQAPEAADADAAHSGTLRVYPTEALAELADQAASDTRAAAKGAGGSLGVGGPCASGSSASGGGGG